jgi:Replication initiator protein, pSAM2
VAGYIAKYATKATESFGTTLDRRLTEGDLEDLGRLELPAHVAELVRACWELGGRPALAGLRLRAWAHMLGFRGHWSTKSRRYSTTMIALRRDRLQFAKRRRARDGIPLDAWERPEEDQAVTVVASWSYVGSGYQTEGGVAGAVGRRPRSLRPPVHGVDRTAYSTHGLYITVHIHRRAPSRSPSAYVPEPHRRLAPLLSGS